jgi:hypothetical protein
MLGFDLSPEDGLHVLSLSVFKFSEEFTRELVSVFFKFF